MKRPRRGHEETMKRPCRGQPNHKLNISCVVGPCRSFIYTVYNLNTVKIVNRILIIEYD
jgi:hypothetical protein